MKRYWTILGAILAGAGVFLFVLMVVMMTIWAILIVRSIP